MRLPRRRAQLQDPNEIVKTDLYGFVFNGANAPSKKARTAPGWVCTESMLQEEAFKWQSNVGIAAKCWRGCQHPLVVCRKSIQSIAGRMRSNAGTHYSRNAGEGCNNEVLS
eukprot:426619-Pelagomonas_calceolata.AAC.1